MLISPARGGTFAAVTSVAIDKAGFLDLGGGSGSIAKRLPLAVLDRNSSKEYTNKRTIYYIKLCKESISILREYSPMSKAIIGSKN